MNFDIIDPIGLKFDNHSCVALYEWIRMAGCCSSKVLASIPSVHSLGHPWGRWPTPTCTLMSHSWIHSELPLIKAYSTMISNSCITEPDVHTEKSHLETPLEENVNRMVAEEGSVEARTIEDAIAVLRCVLRGHRSLGFVVIVCVRFCWYRDAPWHPAGGCLSLD